MAGEPYMARLALGYPERVVFGQYDGYRDEPEVAPDSDVETFVAIEVWIDNRPIAQENDGQITVALPVRAGQRYQLWVGDGAPWDYDEGILSYRMTTWLDR